MPSQQRMPQYGMSSSASSSSRPQQQQQPPPQLFASSYSPYTHQQNPQAFPSAQLYSTSPSPSSLSSSSSYLASALQNQNIFAPAQGTQQRGPSLQPQYAYSANPYLQGSMNAHYAMMNADMMGASNLFASLPSYAQQSAAHQQQQQQPANNTQAFVTPSSSNSSSRSGKSKRNSHTKSQPRGTHTHSSSSIQSQTPSSAPQSQPTLFIPAWPSSQNLNA
jgi:hypothetical protein